MTEKQLKEEILTYDIINFTDEKGRTIECVEVVLTDRIIDVHMDTTEVNVGILAKKIIEQGLYVD